MNAFLPLVFQDHAPPAWRGSHLFNSVFVVLEQRITSDVEYLGALRENENNLVVIKFFAPWCRSCKAMDLKYRRLALENESIKFYEVRGSAWLMRMAVLLCPRRRVNTTIISRRGKYLLLFLPLLVSTMILIASYV